jgi:hypothetical protein
MSVVRDDEISRVGIGSPSSIHTEVVVDCCLHLSLSF